MMDCEDVLFLCQILRTNFYRRKDTRYCDNDESVKESPVIPKHGIFLILNIDKLHDLGYL